MRLLFLIAAVCMVTCTSEVVEPPANPLGHMALFQDGFVSRIDFEFELSKLAPMASQIRPTDRSAFEERLVKKIALEKLILKEDATTQLAQSPGFKSIERQLQRTYFGQNHLRRTIKAQPVTEDALKNYFETHSRRYTTPERRQVFHIFRRTSAETLAEEGDFIQQLRQQILHGASWAELAQAYSHSESRHQGGGLGMVARGKLGEDFDRYVFSLEKGIPSEPIKTAEGYHLFLVQTILDPYSPDLDAIRAEVERDYFVDWFANQRKALADSLPLPDGSHHIPPENLEALLQSGNLNAEVFRVGHYSLRAGEFSRLLNEAQVANAPAAMPKDAHALLRQLWDLERIYQHLENQNTLDFEDPAYQRIYRQALSEAAFKQRLHRFVLQDETRLRQFHQDHAMRFASPLQISLVRWSLPLGNEAHQQMEVLEVLSKANFSKEALEQELLSLGASSRTLGLVTLPQLQRIDSRAAFFAGTLAAGGVSPPYRWEEELVLLQALQRIEPAAQPFERVKEEVAVEVLNQNQAELALTLQDKILQEAKFTLFLPPR